MLLLIPMGSALGGASRLMMTISTGAVPEHLAGVKASTSFGAHLSTLLRT